MKLTSVILLTSSIILLIAPSVFAVGGVIRSGVGMHIGGYGQQSVCENKLNSCGAWPNCLDLTGVKWCVDGKVVEAYCFNNKAKNLTRSSQSCQDSDFPKYQPLSVLLNVSNGAGAKRIVSLTLFKPGTTDTITALSINGSGYVASTLAQVDFKFDYDNSGLSSLVKGLDLSKINQGSEIKVEKVAPLISGVTVYKTYKVELPESFSFSSITLKIKFDDSSVTNPNNLGIYRCGSFDLATNTCLEDWTKLDNVTIDVTNKIATVQINSFSAYSLGESQQQTTTTTTTTPSTTTTTSSSTTTTTQTTSSSTSAPYQPPLGGSYNPTTTTTTRPTTTTTTTQPVVNESENKTENTTTATNQTKTSPVTGLVTSLTANPAILLTPFAGIGAYFAWKSYLSKDEKEHKKPVYKSSTPFKFKPMKKKKKETYTGETRLMLS